MEPESKNATTSVLELAECSAKIGNYFQILDRIFVIFLILFSRFLIPKFQAPCRICARFLILFLSKAIQKYEVTGGAVVFFKKEPLVFGLGGMAWIGSF